MRKPTNTNILNRFANIKYHIKTVKESVQKQIPNCNYNRHVQQIKSEINAVNVLLKKYPELKQSHNTKLTNLKAQHAQFTKNYKKKVEEQQRKQKETEANLRRRLKVLQSFGENQNERRVQNFTARTKKLRSKSGSVNFNSL